MSLNDLTARVSVRRSDGDGGTDHVTDLDDLLEASCQDVFGDVGEGRVTLNNEDAALALVEDGDWLAFSLVEPDEDVDDIVFMARVGFNGPAGGDSNETGTIAQGEERDQVTTLVGPGVLSILDGGAVYPSRGTGALPPEDDRVFNWTAPVFDDSGWATAAVMMSVATAQGPTSGTGDWPYQPFGDGFPPDSGANMIWDAGSTSDLALEGDCYFRKTFTMPGTGWMVLYALIDNIGEVYLDGQRILEVGGFLNASLLQPIELSAGEHLIAVHGHNYPDDGFVGGNPGGIALAVYQADAGGVPHGAPLLVTDSSWKIEAYPAEAPGMTPGEVMRVCLEEAQARGVLTEVTLTFTDTLDTIGQPWPVVTDIATKVGTDILTFFREIAATYTDMWMNADFEMAAVVKGLLATLPPDVTLEAPTDPDDPTTGNLLRLAHRRVGQNPVNALVIKWARGWAEAADSVSILANGRREGLLALGAAQSLPEVLRVGAAELDFRARAREEYSADLQPRSVDELPWLAIHTGFSVTIPDRAGTPVAQPVQSLSAALDADGKVTFAVTAGDRLLSPAERFEQALQKMSNGTLRGTSVVATPASSISFAPAGSGPIPAVSCCPPVPAEGWTLSSPTRAHDGTTITNAFTFDIDSTMTAITVDYIVVGSCAISFEVWHDGVQIVSWDTDELDAGSGPHTVTLPVGEAFATGDEVYWAFEGICDGELTAMSAAAVMTGGHANEVMPWD